MIKREFAKIKAENNEIKKQVVKYGGLLTGIGPKVNSLSGKPKLD